MTKANYPNFARVEAYTLTGEEGGGDENGEGEKGRGKGRRKLPAIKNLIIEKMSSIKSRFLEERDRTYRCVKNTNLNKK